jgi:hypothetical protein
VSAEIGLERKKAMHWPPRLSDETRGAASAFVPVVRNWTHSGFGPAIGLFHGESFKIRLPKSSRGAGMP